MLTHVSGLEMEFIVVATFGLTSISRIPREKEMQPGFHSGAVTHPDLTEGEPICSSQLGQVPICSSLPHAHMIGDATDAQFQ